MHCLAVASSFQQNMRTKHNRIRMCKYHHDCASDAHCGLDEFVQGASIQDCRTATMIMHLTHIAASTNTQRVRSYLSVKWPPRLCVWVIPWGNKNWIQSWAQCRECLKALRWPAGTCRRDVRFMACDDRLCDMSCELWVMNCETWAVSCESWAVKHELWAVSHERWKWAMRHKPWGMRSEPCHDNERENAALRPR